MGAQKNMTKAHVKANIAKPLSNEDIKELSLKEALEVIERKNTKFVWLGVEPVDVISKAIEIPENKVLAITPEELIYYDEDKLKSLKDHVFAGYHDSTSKFVLKFIKSKCGTDAFSLKGGVNSILGDIL
ncbi:hypothetical protein M1373_03805 [Candidatus Marsarchaeota archaeon]|nr:hypothetical protein [Candidatus Marsarchaeota archaeon]MCL5405044.1 hypothetical protein [Candidatus Marsarchaeota archaeon]